MPNVFLERHQEGRLQFGTYLMDRSATMMAGLAKAGFTLVTLDLMWGWNSWQDIHHMVLAAREKHMAAFIRIQGYPWAEVNFADDNFVDHRLLVDVSRAASLGPDGVAFSPSNAAEVRRVVHVMEDWHVAGGVDSSPAELAASEEDRRADLVLQPLIESKGALRDLEEIMHIKGVKSVLMSSTDLPRQLGFPFEYDHPEVYKYLKRAVRLGRETGVVVGCNTGYIFTTVEDTVARIQRLRAIGIDYVSVQADYHLVYSYANSLTQGVGDATIRHDVPE